MALFRIKIVLFPVSMLSYAVAACSMYDWDTFNRLVRLCVQLDVTFLVSVVHDHAVGTAYNGVGM
jgi:hypothetical protein